MASGESGQSNGETASMRERLEMMLNVVRGEAGYTPRNDDSKVFENDIISNISQYQTGASISYSPSTSWGHRLNVGLDYTVQDFVDWKYWDYYASPEGYRENDHDQDRNYDQDHDHN